MRDSGAFRAYGEAAEEAVRARDLLKDWLGEGFLSAEQYARMEQETVCDLRRTNVFLRLVLFLFTLLIVGAGVGLFFWVFLPGAGENETGILLMIIGCVCYAAAEVAVSQARLYRYGIEEALALCSIGSLCAGMQFAFFSGVSSSPSLRAAESVVPAVGIVAALWIWHRFGLAYTFMGAMVFAIWMSGSWTSSPAAQHVILAGLYCAGLATVAAVRRRYRSTYLNGGYSIAEALLWLGIYVAINLQLSPLELIQGWWRSSLTVPAIPQPFYWATWVLIWCLPVVMLARGLRRRDRLVIAVGGISAVLTLVTNKPYLGWPRHTWDPMLLGVLLTGVAILIRRWLAQSPGGVGHGFTAQRLSGKDKSWLNAGISSIGLAAPGIVAPNAPAGAPEVKFGGGDSGGGGASSDF